IGGISSFYSELYSGMLGPKASTSMTELMEKSFKLFNNSSYYASGSVNAKKQIDQRFIIYKKDINTNAFFEIMEEFNKSMLETKVLDAPLYDKITFKKNAGKIQGVSYHTYLLDINLDNPAYAAKEQQKFMADAGFEKMEFIYVFHKGYTLVTSSKEFKAELGKLITNINKGQYNGVSQSKYDLSSYVDLAGLIKITSDMISKQSPESKPIFDMLASSALKLEMNMSYQDSYDSQLVIPYNTISSIAGAVMQMQMQKAMAQPKK
ncbi:MAG: hypothetical protein HQL32_00650, partial [Planctomycetes bacterium]|nr:hypothetical protein [Planctomycetota bacterium]